MNATLISWIASGLFQTLTAHNVNFWHCMLKKTAVVGVSLWGAGIISPMSWDTLLNWDTRHSDMKTKDMDQTWCTVMQPLQKQQSHGIRAVTVNVCGTCVLWYWTAHAHPVLKCNVDNYSIPTSPSQLYFARSICLYNRVRLSSSNGIVPLRRMYAITPTAHMSTCVVYGSRASTLTHTFNTTCACNTQLIIISFSVICHGSIHTSTNDDSI